MAPLNKKYLKWAVALAVIAALGAWVASRWNVWFGMAPEEPYALTEEPQRVMLTFGDSTEMSRNISWQSAAPVRESWVELGSDTVRAHGEVFRSRAGEAAYYVARLRDLSTDTVYRYRVVTGGKASPWYSFTTRRPGRDKFEFIYVGDIQDTIGGSVNTMLREACRAYPAAEFMISGGDLTERPQDKHWAQTFRSVDSIAQAMPIIAVTGNHDYLKGVIRKLERRYSLVFSYYLDSMIGENQVYNLRYGNTEFFMLDSNREFPYLWSQRIWLCHKLSMSTARWRVVVLHHPLHSAKSRWNNLTQRLAFLDVIEDGGVDLVLSGHEHVYARRSTDGHSPVQIISHCAPKCYKANPGDRFDRFVGEGMTYQVVSVDGDTMKITTPGLEVVKLIK